MEILPEHRDLIQNLQNLIASHKELKGGRKLTIGIDGADGVGKSPLGRLLAWQLEMPALETDMFLEKGKGFPSFRYEVIQSLIDWRHSKSRPIIVEGIFLLQILEQVKVNADFLIYVLNKDFAGSCGLEVKLQIYREKYRPQEKAHYIFEYPSEKEM